MQNFNSLGNLQDLQAFTDKMKIFIHKITDLNFYSKAQQHIIQQHDYNLSLTENDDSTVYDYLSIRLSLNPH